MSFIFLGSVCHACLPSGLSLLSLEQFYIDGCNQCQCFVLLCLTLGKASVWSSENAQLRVRLVGRTQPPSEDHVFMKQLSTRLCWMTFCFFWLTTILLLCVLPTSRTQAKKQCKITCTMWFYLEQLRAMSWRPRAISVGWIGRKNMIIIKLLPTHLCETVIKKQWTWKKHLWAAFKVLHKRENNLFYFRYWLIASDAECFCGVISLCPLWVFLLSFFPNRKITFANRTEFCTAVILPQQRSHATPGCVWHV